MTATSVFRQNLSIKEDDAMAQTMTPSVESKTTTAGQIDKSVANYRALLEKHSREFDSESVQSVLGQPEFAGAVFEEFRRRVEAVSNMIVRRVKVNRTQEPKAVIDATGRVQYVNNDVLNNMPRGEDEDKEVFFFKLGRYISDDDLAKDYELRNLVPDPYAQAQANADDPAFADEHPNGCHWKDANGKWCYVAFGRWRDGERYVRVDRRAGAWDDRWWFAGVSK